MKPILVLGPEEPGAPSLECGRIDLCRVAPPAEVIAAASAYDSVIVINDGNADTSRRLRVALDMMRERGGPLTIGVLTYLVVPSLGLEAANAQEWLAQWPHLKLELNGSVLSMEYQAD